ncbi:MAG: hypothetical protein IH987_05745, partial [Planctomycetes bacterium]|nr:hypothetical protein [Planctomycetota bacterium]
MISRKNRMRNANVLTTGCLTLFVLCLFTDGIRAEERKFVVMLAHSPKAFDQGGVPQVPPGGLPDSDIIRKDYFDPDHSLDIDSFAEYWEEISYGDVTVSGFVAEWISLPWAFEPMGPNATPRNSPADYIDLFGSDSGCANAPAGLPPLFSYGAGEVFCDCFGTRDIDPVVTRDKCGALIIIDLIGDPPVVLAEPERGVGLVDSDAVGINVWTPGERFVDVDDDLRWDGIDEKNDMMCHGPDGCRGICSAMICEDKKGYCETEADCLPGVGCIRGSLQHCDDGSGTICSLTNPCSGGSRCVLANMPCPEPTCVGGPQNGEFCNPDNGHNDCLPSGICVSGNADTCTGGETCGDARGSGPRGCDTPGCGDLFMPCVNFNEFDNDDDCDNPNGLNPLTASGCTPPNFLPCVTDEDCPGAPTQRCLRIESFGEVVSMCDPSVAIPCTSDEDCANQSCNTVAELCAVETLCYIPREGVDIELPDCCAADLETDPLTQCEADGGIILCSRYPESDGCDFRPEGIVCGTERLCCEFDDVDESQGLSVVEPFEDFLVRWSPEGFSPGSVWVPLDRDYIKNNYPGDVPALLARVGNGYYDPPDLFFDHLDDAGDPEGTKMMQEAGVLSHTWKIPKPGVRSSYVEKADEPTWFDKWWTARYGSTPPIWPGGDNPGVDNGVRMRPFDPAAPNPAIVLSPTDRRWFRSNRGGWNGAGRGTQDERQLRFDLGGNEWEDAVLPEEEFGYYDGWVEHDDLASSRYHSAGDKRLGEVTSPTTDTVLGVYTAIFGADLGPHDPEQLSPTGDGWGVAAGPGAINIHGENGYDAGDVCLVEWLTWRRDGTSFTSTRMWELENGEYHPFATPAAFTHNYRPTGFCNASTQVACRDFGDCPVGESCVRPTTAIGFRDYNLDGMIDQGEVRPELSENYSVDSNPFTPNNGTG